MKTARSTSTRDAPAVSALPAGRSRAPETGGAPRPLVELRGVSKSFGATRALDGVSFEVRPGEVHVLAGENGAGKSTLIRVLSGVITSFEGELLVEGERVHFRDARDAARHGIATIHQELSLIGSMTVAENLALARPGSILGWIRPSGDERAAREVLADVGLDVDPGALVESLPLAAQQLLEIGRALAQDARVLILDEPTSALSEPEAERLLERVERLAREGRGVVYISHRMEENDRVAHRITVLCDGRVAASREAKDLGREELVALMMGRGRREREATTAARDSSTGIDRDRAPAPRDADTAPPSSRNTGISRPASTALDVRDLRLSVPGTSPLHGVSFTVGRGEIVGLAGLRGAGASEALAALFGVYGPAASATVTLAGAPFSIESPARSIARGLVYLANDRKKTVLYDLDITENVTLSSLPRLAPRGVLSPEREARAAAEMTARLRVAAPSLRALARALSGGNQQKVALLRCLAAGPEVLLFDEPTRGVDIGAKAEIHKALRAAAAGGAAVALVASELPELLDLCDRVVVLSRGRVASTLEKKDFSREGLRLALDAATTSPPPAQTIDALER
jgi:ribose transport system ATP-binding protein